MARTSKSVVLQEVATLEKDLQNPARSGVYINPDATLQTRGGFKGLSIYDDVERDAHAFGVLQKRKLAVIAASWDFFTSQGDGAEADAAALDATRAALDATGFDALTADLLEATLKGFSVVEVMWGVVSGLIMPIGYIPRDPNRFAFDDKLQLRMRTPQNIYPGEPLPPRKFIVHSFGSKNGNPYGLGLGSKLWHLAWFKREVLKLWADYAERHAGPTGVASMPAGSGEVAFNEALRLIESLGSRTGVALPEGVQLDYLEPRASADAVFKGFIEMVNAELSKAVLGETLTTEMGAAGSRAASETHNGVRIELARADADGVCATINKTLIKWIYEVNWPSLVPPRVYRTVGAGTALLAEIERDLSIAKLGYTPSLEYVQSKYGEHWQPAGGISAGIPAAPAAGAAA